LRKIKSIAAAAGVFGSGRAPMAAAPGVDVKVLHAKIGQQAHAAGVAHDTRARCGKNKARHDAWLCRSVVERRRIELPTFALRTRRSPS
jgi:hypothetical protein